MSDETIMGYQDKVFMGTANAQAATRIDRATDINYSRGNELGETTTRGDSSGPPVVENDVAALTAEVTFSMVEKADDAQLAALIAAADTGAAVAIAYKRANTGKGFDGDCVISYDEPAPLKGVKIFAFTCTPTSKGGRLPLLNETIAAT